MEKVKILVVDDESRMRKLVRDFLEREGFQVLEAGDGVEAMDIFYENRDLALIILDIMMPKMDGWQVCREVRQSSQVPIIMLTARGEERDELQGFSLGVDEYISKPFSPKILVARVEAILRRTSDAQGGEKLEAGGIELDKTAHIVKLDGEPVELSYKEFELLAYFMENSGVALSRRRSSIMCGITTISAMPGRSTPMSRSCEASWATRETILRPSGAWATNLRYRHETFDQKTDDRRVHRADRVYAPAAPALRGILAGALLHPGEGGELPGAL